VKAFGLAPPAWRGRAARRRPKVLEHCWTGGGGDGHVVGGGLDTGGGGDRRRGNGAGWSPGAEVVAGAAPRPGALASAIGPLRGAAEGGSGLRPGEWPCLSKATAAPRQSKQQPPQHKTPDAPTGSPRWGGPGCFHFPFGGSSSWAFCALARASRRHFVKEGREEEEGQQRQGDQEREQATES